MLLMFDASFAALAVGTFWFWFTLLFAFVLVTALVENEHGTFAALSLIITVALLQWASGVPILTWLVDHPWKTALLVIGYFIAGALWGYFKWVFYVHKQLNHYKEYKADWLRIRNAEGMTPSLIEAFRNDISKRYSRPAFEVNPSAREHKADILRWMTYWPFSAFWTIINDPVRKAFRAIYIRMQASMQRVSDRAFQDVRTELGRD